MSNETFFDNIWFSGVNPVGNCIKEGVYYCGPVNTSHKGFWLSTLEKCMKELSGGSYITTIVPYDIPLITAGWN